MSELASDPCRRHVLQLVALNIISMSDYLLALIMLFMVIQICDTCQIPSLGISSAGIQST